VLAEAAEGGADLVQVREPGLSDAEIVALTARVVGALEGSGTMVLVNDRFDIALAAGASGVHLKSTGIPTAEVRRALGPGPVIARSTHHPDEARRAGEEGADLVVFGPVFATPSKSAYGPPAGLEALQEACAGAGIPVLALGGVEPANAAACIEAGAAGVAAIHAALGEGDVEANVRALRAAACPEA
jgi:thiamine-phosphate pyrophosphorylase